MPRNNLRAHSEATKARISEAMKGRRYGPEHRAKIAEGQKRSHARRREAALTAEATKLLRTVMLEDARRQDATRHSQSSAARHPTERVRMWCEQCESLVGKRCASPFCKA